MTRPAASARTASSSPRTRASSAPIAARSCARSSAAALASACAARSRSSSARASPSAASARGRTRPDLGGVRRRAGPRQPHLLRRLLRACHGVGERHGALLQRRLELRGPRLLALGGGERHRVGRAQQLGLAPPGALLVELAAQPAHVGHRSRQRLLPRGIEHGHLDRRRGLGRRRRRRGLQGLQPPLELRAAQLEHLERLERVRRAARLLPLGRLGAAGAALGEHRAVDHLAAVSGSGAAASAGSGAPGGSKPRSGAASPERAPLSQLSQSSGGGSAISAAGTRYVPRQTAGSRPKRASGSDSNCRSSPPAPQAERGQRRLPRPRVGPAAAHADEPRVRTGREPFHGLDDEAVQGGRWR